MSDNVTPQPPNGSPDNALSTEAKESKYNARLKALGRAAVGLEVPLELHEMMLLAAKADNDIAISAWVRKAFANAVNALDLRKEDGTSWKFDIKILDDRPARASSTKNLPPEEKAKVEAKRKEAAKDQRALVARLLLNHKRKLQGLPPLDDDAPDPATTPDASIPDPTEPEETETTEQEDED